MWSVSYDKIVFIYFSLLATPVFSICMRNQRETSVLDRRRHFQPDRPIPVLRGVERQGSSLGLEVSSVCHRHVAAAVLPSLVVIVGID